MKKNTIRALMIYGIIGFSSLANADLNDGLVAYYPFNGNANDESSRGNHGVVHGANLTLDRFGKLNRAYYFDGQDNYIDLGKNISSKYFTVSSWVKPFSTNSSRYSIVSSRESSPPGINEGFVLAIAEGTNGKARIWVKTNDIWNPSPTDTSPLNMNEWVFLIGVYNGSSIKLYRNNELVAELARVGEMDTRLEHTVIGARASMERYFFHGVIDDVRIYNRALSETEIQELYNEGSTPNREEATRYIPATETLHLPRVEVGMQQYSARLKLTDAENSLNFKLVEAVPIESAGLNNASFAGSLLKIPMVKVPNRAGFDAYNANLTLIPDASPIEFKLNNADLISSDYSEHAVSLASAVIESYMKNAKDTIVSFRVEGGAIKYTLFRYKAATQELVNGSIQVLASGAFASMETYGGCKNDVTSLKCVKTVEKILASTLTGLGAGIICSPAGPYAAVACSSGASILTKLALDKAYELAFDSGIFIHKAVVVVSDQATEVYDFGVSVYRSDIGGYLDWVAICLSDIRRNCRY